MTYSDFHQSNHTLVLSDIHLSDAQEPGVHHPLWKRFKRAEHFVDADFLKFLAFIQTRVSTEKELVLNGDIFDFDSVMVIPEKRDPSVKVNWVESLRGLFAEEPKSRFKFKSILDAHPVWLAALRQWVMDGNRVVFVIGNHDLELHWPSVRQDLVDRLNLPELQQGQVRFCEWFYISNADTLIEHGNQYDAYCLCSDPIHPLINRGAQGQVRMPFGNLAGKFMVNGMGFLNPHATGSFIKNSIWDYLVFYFKYVFKTQPFLLWTWFWSAFVTLVYSLIEGFLPPMKDPLTIGARLQDIAQRSNASVPMVLALKDIHVHPAIFNPLKILRELWLDRALLLVAIVFVSFQFFSFLHVFSPVSLWWFVFPMGVLMPGFILYARSVESEVEATQQAAFEMAPLSAKVANVQRIVQGHTHHEFHHRSRGVEVLNTGTWSPAYRDPECIQPYGRKCFAWIQPSGDGRHRFAELYEWTQGQAQRIAVKAEPRAQDVRFSEREGIPAEFVREDAVLLDTH
jgi:UDP-2,3-diacylglucosamine pyrophosphatase LpxH